MRDLATKKDLLEAVDILTLRIDDMISQLTLRLGLLIGAGFISLSLLAPYLK